MTGLHAEEGNYRCVSISLHTRLFYGYDYETASYHEIGDGSLGYRMFCLIVLLFGLELQMGNYCTW